MTAHCPHCHALTPSSPHALTRKLVLGLGWTVAMSMVAGGSLLGPAVIPALPIIVFAGMGLVTGAHAFAHGDRVCDACGRAYEIDGERIAAAPVGRAPASALAVET